MEGLSALQEQVLTVISAVSMMYVKEMEYSVLNVLRQGIFTTKLPIRKQINNINQGKTRENQNVSR